MTGRRIVQQSRELNRVYDLYEPEEGVNELYVDGNAVASIGPAISKLDFFVVTGAKKDDDALVEERLTKLRLVIPTANLAEVCALILTNMSKLRQEISIGFDDNKAKFLGYLPPVKGDRDV